MIPAHVAVEKNTNTATVLEKKFAMYCKNKTVCMTDNIIMNKKLNLHTKEKAISDLLLHSGGIYCSLTIAPSLLSILNSL